MECVYLSKRENWDKQFNGQTWRAQWRNGGKRQKRIYNYTVDRKADSHWMKVGEMKMGRYRHGVGVPGPVEIRYISVCCWRICAELSRWRRRQL